MRRTAEEESIQDSIGDDDSVARRRGHQQSMSDAGHQPENSTPTGLSVDGNVPDVTASLLTATDRWRPTGGGIERRPGRLLMVGGTTVTLGDERP